MTGDTSRASVLGVFHKWVRAIRCPEVAADAGFREITRMPAAARTQALSAMMTMIARLNAVALNSAARPKMMLATPKATAV